MTGRYGGVLLRKPARCARCGGRPEGETAPGGTIFDWTGRHADWCLLGRVVLVASGAHRTEMGLRMDDRRRSA